MKKYLRLLFCCLSQAAIAQSYHFDLIKDINTQTEDASVFSLLKVGNQAILIQDVSDTARLSERPYWKLWKSDGTTANYFAKTSDFYGVYWGARVVNDRYIFMNHYNMGLSDGNSSQVKKIPYISESAGYLTVQPDPVFFQNKLFFQSQANRAGQQTGSGEELMYYDETTDESYLLKDICVSGGSEPRGLTVVGDKLFFTADDANRFYGFNRELWVTDGTHNGTRMVKNINPSGSGLEYWSRVAKIGNKVIFEAFDGINKSLYLSDGTEAGTYPFKNLQTFSENQNQSVSLGAMYEVGDKMFLFMRVGSRDEIWVTDGTNANTRRVTYYRNYGIFGPKEIASKDGYIFFIDNNNALYKTDGNTVVLLSEGHNLLERTFKMAYNPANQNLYFSYGKSIYQTTGYSNGTTLFNNKFHQYYPGEDYPIEFEIVNNKILALCRPKYFDFGLEL